MAPYFWLCYRAYMLGASGKLCYRVIYTIAALDSLMKDGSYLVTCYNSVNALDDIQQLPQYELSYLHLVGYILQIDFPRACVRAQPDRYFAAMCLINHSS